MISANDVGLMGAGIGLMMGADDVGSVGAAVGFMMGANDVGSMAMVGSTGDECVDG